VQATIAFASVCGIPLLITVILLSGVSPDSGSHASRESCVWIHFASENNVGEDLGEIGAKAAHLWGIVNQA
jgi:hypothetical protein